MIFIESLGSDRLIDVEMYAQVHKNLLFTRPSTYGMNPATMHSYYQATTASMVDIVGPGMAKMRV